MKRKIVLAISILGLLIVFIGGYFVFDSIFPKAESIECPLLEDIVSVSVTLNNADETRIITQETEAFLQNIKNAKPTRRQSVNDYPGTRPFYSIEVKTSQREYHYFLYQEGTFYLEMPYQGIYYSTADFYDVISQMFMQ